MPVTQISEAPHVDDATMKLDFLWLELTQKCNLSCSHCYVSSGPDRQLHDRMKHEDWLRVISDASQFQCKSVQFIGGEPLLYPRIDELIEAAREKGFQLIEIFTNGTPITHERAKQFSRWNVQVACSVYSDDPLVHDKITRVPGSFEKTIDALQRLVDRCVPVRVGFIEMEANAGNFAKTCELLRKLGITSVGHDNIRSFGRGAGTAPPIDAANSASPFDGLCGQCSRGRICVTNSGEAFPCIMSRTFPVGNVLESGFASVVGGEKLREFRTGMNECFGWRPNSQACKPTTGPCMVCGPGVCSPDYNPCVPEVPTCGPTGPT